jgi:hypothetical protein
MDSEINQDPLYSPECVTQVRPPEVILITTGNTVVFGSTRSQLEPGAFEVGNPANANCGGCSSAPGGGSAPTASAPTEAPVITGVEEQIYEINTLGAVYNDPTTPTIFTIYDTWLVTEIVNYHWNDAQGAEPGTIALQAEDGTLYGPWQAHTLPGQGGVPNAYWVVNPQVVLPPGTYTVIDSDPSTWAQNSETGGIGISWGKGIKQQ